MYHVKFTRVWKCTPFRLRNTCLLIVFILDAEELEEEEGAKDEDAGDVKERARPRRLSELKIPNKVKPIPMASSLFVFSPTNKWVGFLFIGRRLFSSFAEGGTVSVLDRRKL